MQRGMVSGGVCGDAFAPCSPRIGIACASKAVLIASLSVCQLRASQGGALHKQPVLPWVQASSAVASGTSPDELIAKAKTYIVNSGFFGPLTEETNAMLDDEFVHRGTRAFPAILAWLDGAHVSKQDLQ